MEERIHKILAQMGIASRRKAEDLVIESRVTVNGKPATVGMKVNPAKDHIKVNGKLLKSYEPKVYFMFNKPRSVITSMSDPGGRAALKDFLTGIRFRVFPVGRLDYDSEGLLLITNDGDLAHSLLHPSGKIPKTYAVKVKGMITESALERLRRGIMLDDGLTSPARVRAVRRTENNSWIEITIQEGRNRQVRRMLERVGHPVIKLKRTAINGLKLGDLGAGQIRRLTSKELGQIKAGISQRQKPNVGQ